MVTLGADRFPAVLGAATLPTPVLVAAGCAGSGVDLLAWGDVAQLGAVTSPTLRLGERPEDAPAVRPAPGGLLWEPGESTVTVGAYLAHVLPAYAEAGGRVVLALAGSGASELAELAARVAPAGEAVVGVELRLTDRDGAEPYRRVVDDLRGAARVVARVRGELPETWPLLVRVEDERQPLVPLVAALTRAGADGLIVSGAVGTWAPGRHGARPGLLCGPALLGATAARLRAVHLAARAGDLEPVPLLGVGGVRSAQDAAWLMGHGATAVAVGSGVLADPTLPWRVVHELPPLVRTGSRRTAAAAAGALLADAPAS